MNSVSDMILGAVMFFQVLVLLAAWRLYIVKHHQRVHVERRINHRRRRP